MSTATQVESFCESCGTRYAFEPRRPRGRHLVRVGRMVGILADDADVDSSALMVSRDPFHGAFHFCLECRRFTCPSCWDTSAGFCRSCAMATGASDAEAQADHDPDPETEAILQAALASLLELGSHEAWQRLEPPPAPRAEIWAAPPELVDTPSDDMAPIIEAGLAALGAKQLVENERLEAEAEQRRLAEELRLHEQQLAADQAEQVRLEAEAQQHAAQQAYEAQQAYDAEQGRLAWEAEQARLADEGRRAWEADQSRLADAARIAAVAALVGQAHEAPPAELPETQDSVATDPGAPAEHPAPPEWTALATSLGPDVEPSVAAVAAGSQDAPEPVVLEHAVESTTPGPDAVVPAIVAEATLATPEATVAAPETTVAAPEAAAQPSPDQAPVVPDVVALAGLALVAEAVAPQESTVWAPPEAAAPSVVDAVPAPEPVAWVPPAPPAPEPVAWVQPAPPAPVMPPMLPPPPPPPPVAWQMTAPSTPPPHWAPPPPPPGWMPSQMPMTGRGGPGHPRNSRSGFTAAPLPGPVKGGVRPCPRCDLPLSGQARFCRRCGLPQT